MPMYVISFDFFFPFAFWRFGVFLFLNTKAESLEFLPASLRIRLQLWEQVSIQIPFFLSVTHLVSP